MLKTFSLSEKKYISNVFFFLFFISAKEPQPLNDHIVEEAVAFDGSTFLQFSEGKKGAK